MRNINVKEIHFAIMLENKVIGDVYLKNIDHIAKCCEMGIHMTCDRYKGNGYGTRAESLLLNIAFNKLKMEVVRADTLIKNIRSRRALEKAGFVEINRDDSLCYYEFRKNH